MEYSLMTWIKRFGGVSALAATVALSPITAMAAHHEAGEAAEAPAEAAVEEAAVEEAPAGLTGNVDLSGSWAMSVETPDGGVSEGTLTFTEADDSVSGLWETDLGDATFDDVEIDGNSIEFAAEVDMGGVLMPLSFVGTIGGSSIQGTLVIEMEGAEPMELPTTGARELGEVDLPGVWALNVELPDGSVSESALTVTESDAGLVALIETELGEATIDGITIEGNAVSFETSIDMGGMLIPFSFEGTSGGSVLAGVVSLDMDGQVMELPITGIKDEAAAPGEGGPVALTGPVNLIGSWDVEAELPDGSVSSSAMTVIEEDGKIVAILETEIGEARIDTVVLDGNLVSYEAEIDMGGMLIPLTFVGSTGGDALQGVISLDMDGTKMELPITGTRAAEAAPEEAAAEASEETAAAE